MPQTQVAQVASYEAGAPTVTAAVQTWTVSRGGEVDFLLTNDGDQTLTASVEVSTDGASWSATTAGANQTAVTAVTIVPRAANVYTVLLRAGIDLFVRITASGGTRMGTQVRRHELAGLQDIRF